MKRCGALLNAFHRGRWSSNNGRSASMLANMQSLVGLSDEKISRLPNGLVVASLDMGGPVSQLVLGFRAGTRYELPDEAGLVHHIRNCFGSDSKNYHGAQLIWQCGSSGMNVNSTMTRDLLMVQASVVRDHAAVGLSLLGELAQPAFKPWDIEEFKNSILIDRAHLGPYDILLEHLHDAAFRSSPLGNRLYAGEDAIGQFHHAQFERYAASRMVTGNAVMFGLNIPHEQMVDYATNQFTLKESKGDSPKPSQYIGGESRCKSLTKHAHVAIAGEGASLKSIKNLAVQAILSTLLGENKSMKYSTGVGQGPIANAVLKASSGNPFGLSSVSEVYTDTGIIGLYLVAEADRIGPILDAAIKAIMSLEITDEILETSRKNAIMNVLSRSESSELIAIDRATQLLANDKTENVADLIKSIESVTSSEIKKAVDHFKARMTLVSHGNIYQVPYLDKL